MRFGSPSRKRREVLRLLIDVSTGILFTESEVVIARYFIDERVGCIAIRDRELTNPEYRGLHRNTKGVVWYRHGTFSRQEWSISNKDREAAKEELERLLRVSSH